MDKQNLAAKRRAACLHAVLLAGLLGAGNLRAFHGMVETSDGARFEGEIRLDQNVFAITGTNGSSQRVGADQLSLLRADESPKAPLPLPEHGLRATYFNSRDLTGRAWQRIDPMIDFDWKTGSPFKEINADSFSVRWEGQIEPATSAKFTFYPESSDGVRLWINDRKIIDEWRDQHGVDHKRNGSIELQAEKKYGFKMDYYKHEGPPVVRLLWGPGSRNPVLVPSERFFPSQSEPSPELQVAEEPESRDRRSAAGVQLTGGSFIAKRVLAADSTSIKFSESPKEASVSILHVARIYFQPPTSEMDAKLPPGRTGLLLKSNDFIESEFQGIARDGKIRINSVLFGLKSYVPWQVQALALRDPEPVAAKFELRTKSDSCLRVNAFSMDKDKLIIQDSTMAGLQILARDLAEIRKCQPAK